MDLNFPMDRSSPYFSESRVIYSPSLFTCIPDCQLRNVKLYDILVLTISASYLDESA